MEITIHNVETGEVIVRPFNDEELKQWEKDKKIKESIEAAEAESATKRQILLDKLGITEEEAKLLLGGN